MSKLGILGGTFDPPHLGHTRLAESARDQFQLDLVLFIPAGEPYHRRPGSGFEIAGVRSDLSTASDRLAMTRLAVAAQRDFAVDDREVRRGGASYTVETLEEIAAERPTDELYLLLGADSAAELHRWRRPERIAELATIAVASRDLSSPSAGIPDIPVLEIDMPAIDITSTMVRDLVRRRRPFRHLVAPTVAHYIVRRGLYLAAGPPSPFR